MDEMKKNKPEPVEHNYKSWAVHGVSFTSASQPGGIQSTHDETSPTAELWAHSRTPSLC